MYNKDELLSKDSAELEQIAAQLGVDMTIGDDKEAAVYTILDHQAEAEAGAHPLPTERRKRTRIAKRDDHVYSVTGSEGENFDKKSARTKAKAQPSLFKEIPAQADEEPVAPAPRKRGRPRKVQVEADTAAEEAPKKATRTRKTAVKAAVEEPLEQPVEQAVAEQVVPEADMTPEVPEMTPEADEPQIIPEAEFATGAPKTDEATSMLAQLQEKMAAHNEQAEETRSAVASGVWEGDPGDGTDFITLIDLPVEDMGVMPVYDMFDRPMAAPQQPASQQPMPLQQRPAAPAQQQMFNFDGLIEGNGVLEVMPDGYGFLRSSDYNYLSSPDDVYVPMPIVRRYGLKTGDVVSCTVRPPHEGEKYFPITDILKINGREPGEVRDRVPFEHLTPLFPEEKFTLCGDPKTTNASTRVVDLFSPIGKGQRALIVAQPKTGKTFLMKDIANAIAANHPEAYLMMLLIDERPEEVTDMARTVNAEVIASTFDEPAERHVKIAGMVLEKAKRLVEAGHDVVIFLDSITRLARAYNTVAPASGKVLTGGVDANALQKPKRFFGAARNIEGGGSLTIVATALIDTGSKMDEVIFEEFKGTGNMELQLDRALANKRIFPAVNLVASSTRRDDLLQDSNTVDKMRILRNFIADMNAIEAMNSIHTNLVRCRSNEEFLMSMNS